MKSALAISLGLVGMLLASAAPAATLNVVGGQLVGASGVDVGGVLYDVEFVADTCIALFDGCDAVSDFAFTDQAAAIAAAQALLGMVFIDGPDGAFDTDPELTQGCVSLSNCFANIPFGFRQGTNPLLVAAAANQSISTDSNILDFSTPNFDYATRTNLTYAVFSVVPEPNTGLLMTAGLVLMSVRRRAPSAR